MRLYLVQHGKPVSKEEDPEQPLSNEGKNDIERMASFLAKMDLDVKAVFHSGKTRAEETADIMVAHLSPDKPAMKRDGLLPLDDIREIVGQIKRPKEHQMMVGHLPHLAKLTSHLITGEESVTVIQFQQGCVACLEKAETGGWAIVWMLTPEMID